MTQTTAAEMNLYQVLETLLFNQVAQGLKTGAGHNSRIARVLPDSWQARLLRTMPDLRHVTDAADLAQTMADPATPVLFIGDEVIMDGATLAHVCAASGLDKIVIWEDGGIA